MNHPILFTPTEIGNLKLANRIVIAPMAQYSAEDGQMNDWAPDAPWSTGNLGCGGANN